MASIALVALCLLTICSGLGAQNVNSKSLDDLLQEISPGASSFQPTLKHKHKLGASSTEDCTDRMLQRLLTDPVSPIVDLQFKCSAYLENPNPFSACSPNCAASYHSLTAMLQSNTRR